MPRAGANPPSLRQVLSYAVAGIAAFVVAGLAIFGWADREASRNFDRCKSIRPGAMLADLTRQLTGAEFYRYDGRET